jgi:hypothetical protein
MKEELAMTLVQKPILTTLLLLLTGTLSMAWLLGLPNPIRAAEASGEAAEVAVFDGTPGEGYRLVGKIRPRHAREIAASSWSVGAETMDRDFTVYANWREHLGPLGAKAARIQSGWAKTEKVKGQYDWAWLDEIVLDMVKQGVKPWVCICYGNPVYPGGGGTGLGDGIPTSDEALQAWDRYVAALVDRYKEHVDQWEVWNEPGLRGANTAERYADLLIRTAEATRGQQPDAKIIGFAMAGIKLPWVKGVLDIVKEQDKLDLIDELSYHPYSYNPDSSYSGVQKLRDLVQSYSPKITLRQGENGTPSARGSFGALSDNDWTEESQAKWALRRLLGDLARDIPSSYFAICDMEYPTRRNLKGLLAINNDKTVAHRKEGYFAVQHLTAVFDDSLRRIAGFKGKIEGVAKPESTAVFAYRNEAGGNVVTLWRASDTPGKNSQAEPATVALPGLRFEKPVWVDLRTGKVFEIDPSLVTADEAGSVFRQVPIYDSPVLIAERSAIPTEASPTTR